MGIVCVDAGFAREFLTFIRSLRRGVMMFSMKASLRVTIATFFFAITITPSILMAGAVPAGVSNSVISAGIESPAPTPTAPSAPSPPGVNYVPPAPAPAPATSTNVTGAGGASQNQAALGSQASNNSASDASKAIGTALLGAGTSMMPPCAAQMCGCCPMAAMLIAMGLMGLMQSGANKGTAGQHAGNAALNQDYMNPAASNDSISDPTRDPATVSTSALGRKAVADLKQYGISYDTKSGKFTLPNGKSFSMSDVGNPKAMGDAGVSEAQYKQAMAMASDAEKKAATDALLKSKMAGFDNPANGGGGGSQNLKHSPDDEVAGGVAGKEMPKPDGNVAGMARNFNGDKIGVSGDDIFAMMARRYREKENKESFLSPDAAPDASL